MTLNIVTLSIVTLRSDTQHDDKQTKQQQTKIVRYRTADSKPVKQEVNSTVVLPPLVFPGSWVDK